MKKVVNIFKNKKFIFLDIPYIALCLCILIGKPKYGSPYLGILIFSFFIANMIWNSKNK